MEHRLGYLLLAPTPPPRVVVRDYPPGIASAMAQFGPGEFLSEYYLGPPAFQETYGSLFEGPIEPTLANLLVFADGSDGSKFGWDDTARRVLLIPRGCMNREDELCRPCAIGHNVLDWLEAIRQPPFASDDVVQPYFVPEGCLTTSNEIRALSPAPTPSESHAALLDHFVKHGWVVLRRQLARSARSVVYDPRDHVLVTIQTSDPTHLRSDQDSRLWVRHSETNLSSLQQELEDLGWLFD